MGANLAQLTGNQIVSIGTTDRRISLTPLFFDRFQSESESEEFQSESGSGSGSESRILVLQTRMWSKAYLSQNFCGG